MDRDQFLKNIQEADTKSLRDGAANRIVQLLEKQRYSNNENSVNRWIWELCQNAKDVCNNTGKVKISIGFDKSKKSVTFKHNGRAFSINNIMSLINQASSKDRNSDSERTSGKFGTGFITTHLLSEIVDITGICEMGVDEYSKFQITLDRTGHTKAEIVEALEKSVEQLWESQTILEGGINFDDYNTIFEYKLNDIGSDVAEQGIENLRVSAPFVLSMLKDIGELVLETTEEMYRYNRQIDCGLENSAIHEIIYKSKEAEKKIYVLNCTEGNTTISIALERKDDGIYILPFQKQQSKLFCDFPLIGTEDFPFPVLVCSQDFNPTEPRDGIYLTCKTIIDDNIQQNRSIIENACKLYKSLLEYVAKKKWDGIYNITQIDSYRKKDWYDEKWLNAIVDECKNIILTTPIICTESGSMIELQDCFDEPQVYIISEDTQQLREELWDLLKEIMPEKIPCKKDVHNWYKSLWRECNRYTSKSLTKQLEHYGCIDELQENIVDGDWDVWLSQYYDFIESNKELVSAIVSKGVNIIPNQKGVFCHAGELKFDKDIIDGYKDILEILDYDCKEWLLNSKIDNREWFKFEEYDNERVLKIIEGDLADADQEQKDNIFFKMIYMYDDKHEGLSVQNKICKYSNDILMKECQMVNVPLISENILKDALKYTITCVAAQVSECVDVQGLSLYLDKSTEEMIDFLAEFIEFVVKQGYDNLINKTTKPILPNQNGKFMIKDDIFLDANIDETLKELAVIAGYDIKEELLEKKIYLKLPESRWKGDEDVSYAIIQFVNNNRTSKEEYVRIYFKKLLIWICDHEECAKNIFPELYKNKHYLYDDDEIAQNIRQAETLNNIMRKFDISSPEKLEEIIRNNRQEKSEETIDEKIEVTEEVLLQLGIDSEQALEDAFLNESFASRFIRNSKHNVDTYEYVKRILERSKNNIIEYLNGREEYDLTEIETVSSTIFIIKKNGKEIYLMTRPSDGSEVRIYYKAEMDVLDYTMDWELWVEDGRSEPQKITFGKIIKLTGLNRIPLKGR